MIHNPSATAAGEKKDMEQAIAVLEEVKESILNAYVAKTGLSRNRLAKMMDAETWLNANEAMRLGFVDGILFAEDDPDKKPEEEPDEPDEPGKKEPPAQAYSRKQTVQGAGGSGEAGTEQKRQDRGRCTAACKVELIKTIRRKNE